MNEQQHARGRTILIVDDTASARESLAALLQHHYQVEQVADGAMALSRAAAGSPPDLILLDSDMPGMSGFEVCRALKSSPATQGIPVIFLLATVDPEHEARCFESGGADCIAQPFYPATVRARVETQLALKASMTAEAVTIFALTSLAETRDSDTGNHILRTQNYVKTLALRLQQNPKFARVLTNSYIATLYKSVPLYDMGSIGIPDRILLKPSSLTATEFDLMKTHTTLGRDAIENAEKTLGAGAAFLATAKEMVYSHQEKWDGSGYPQGLAGEQIPVSARLMAIADVYDALISPRVYKEGLPHDKAVQIIFQSRASHFDPDMVDAFIEIQDDFYAVAQRYADTEVDLQKKIEYLANAIAENP
jgi:putative two-component system response regulator